MNTFVVRELKVKRKIAVFFNVFILFLCFNGVAFPEGRFTTVNFHNIPLAEVAEYVSQTAKVGIIFSGIEDRITWNQTFLIDNLFLVFSSVLNAQGYYFASEGYGLWSIRKHDQGTDINSGAHLVMTLRNVSANDLKESVNLLFGNKIRIAGGEKEGRVIIITGQLSLLQKAFSIIQQFDDSSEPVKDHEIVDISHELTRKIEPRLRSVLGETVGITSNPWSKQILIKGTPSQRLLARAVVEMMDKPQADLRRVVRLHRLTASDVVTVIKELAEAVVVHAVGSQEVLLTGPSSEVLNLVDVVRDLDGGREQVRVDAIIAVLSDDGLEQLGTKLEMTDSGLVENFVAQGLAVDGPNLLMDLVTGRLKVHINASKGESTGRVLSSPSLTVLDGQTASILVGQNIPLIAKHQSGTSGDKESHDGVEVNRVDVGLSLQITPGIEGDFVRLKILQEVSGISQQNVGAVDISTNVRRIETSVLVPNGQTLYLGGVREDETGATDWKVPILGDLPIVGMVFQSSSQSRRGSNLVISIKPSVISRDGDGVRELSL
ncbi:MAG: hypothetical protein HQL84_11980 [Magnetococcales bacterium]|nr:hypothetical protein [Magnetococcales bacterium]MBF0150752.1 hypothetical protein [Magnetococcales bacterium]MBF0630145.1 hypothetical protein [Magnetococcales bacterium]